MTNSNEPLDLFEYLLDHFSHDLTLGLASMTQLNDETRHQVQQLINAHIKNQAATFFHQTIEKSSELLSDNVQLSELTGRNVSHFKLERLLGSGGMGVVYLANRNDGKFNQQVAIKIIYPTITVLHGPQNLTREAQYLALLNHPNIASVLDAGECEFGMYMVMEYIEGTTLLSYCEKQKLNTKQRLALFCKVCNAVNYAHQNRVIHADLKPSNILVNKNGEPKLVDFGVARYFNHEQADVVIDEYISALSHEFASPEQRAGKGLTTQSDVYSLGKMFNQLLNSDHNTTRYSSDLNLVFNKATAITLSARYNSVLALQADLEAILEDNPLAATTKKNTFFYTLTKRFYRQPLMTCVVTFFALTIVTMTGALFIKNQHLNEQYMQKSAIIDYLKDVFYAADPRYYNGEKPDYAQLLYSGSSNLDTQLAGQNEARIEIKKIISRALLSLGDFEKAKKLLQSDHLHSDLSIPLAETLFYQGQYTEAEALLNSLSLAYGSEEWIEKVILISAIHIKNGNNKQAIQHLGLLSDINPNSENKKRQLIRAAVRAAIAYDELSQYPSALKEIQKATALAEATYPKDHIGLLDVYNTHGNILSSLGQLEQASEMYQMHLKITEKVLGLTHPSTGNAYRNIGYVEEMQDNFELAIDYYKRSESIFLQSYGEQHEQLAFLWNDIGIASRLKGDFEQSQHYLIKAETAARSALSETNPNIASILGNLAIAQFYLNNHQQAIETLHAALKIDLAASGELNSRTAHRYYWLGFIYANEGDYQQALQFNTQSVAIFTQINPNGSQVTWDALMHNMVILLAQQNNPELENSFIRSQAFIDQSEQPENFINDLNTVKILSALQQNTMDKAKLAADNIIIKSKNQDVYQFWKNLVYKKPTDLSQMERNAYNHRGAERAQALNSLQHCFIAQSSLTNCAIASPVLLLL